MSSLPGKVMKLPFSTSPKTLNSIWHRCTEKLSFQHQFLLGKIVSWYSSTAGRKPVGQKRKAYDGNEAQRDLDV